MRLIPFPVHIKVSIQAFNYDHFWNTINVDCERAFASSKELLHHHSSYRHRGQPLKRTPDPFEPVNTEPLPPLPLTLPSYMIIPRRIAQHPISKVVHNWLGAKVSMTCEKLQIIAEGRPHRSWRTYHLSIIREEDCMPVHPREALVVLQKRLQ